MERRLIAIVGPTASGKSALALQLAGRIGGEIVNGDSRQVYIGMDIGTAKPSAAERALLPHHLFDHVLPSEPYSLGVYRGQALAAFEQIWERAAIPILAGGTGQYIWALLEDWTVPEVPPDIELRERLYAESESAGFAVLHDRLQAIDPISAVRIDGRNVRRVVRALEVYELTGTPLSTWQQKREPNFRFDIYGLSVEREELDRRINARVDAMFAAGFVDEVTRLRAEGFGRELPSMSSIGYSQVHQFLDGECTIEEAVAGTKQATRRFARKQGAWFRPGDARIRWVKSIDDIPAE